MVYQKYNSEEKLRICKLIEKGFSTYWIEKNLGIPDATTSDWWRTYSKGKSLEPMNKTGRKRKLAEAEINVVLEELDRNPSASNKRLAQLVGEKVVPQSISNYIKYQEIPYTSKKYQDDDPNCFKMQTIQTSREFLMSIESIAMNRRIYQDESYLYDNESPSKGRAPKGKRIPRKKKRRGKRYPFAIAISENGLLHDPILQKESFNDSSFKNYVEKYIIPNLKQRKIVFWDRLGRSGKKKNPNKQHFNPAVEEWIRKKNSKLIFLPPYGKYFNPCELANGYLKSRVRQLYQNSQAYNEGRLRTFDELQDDLLKASKEITPEMCKNWFNERATDKDYTNFLSNNIIS